MSFAGIDEALSAARSARQSSNDLAVIESLTKAVELADVESEPSWVHLTRWRLAKAHFDFGEISAVLPVLEPLISDGALIAHYSGSLSGLGPLSARIWDEVGYGNETLRELWALLAKDCRAASDPYLAAWCETQLAWDWVGAGDFASLEQWLYRWEHQVPDTFGDGPNKAVAAPDTPSSVYWVQQDVARTVLRAAVWGSREELAFRAKELYLDAVADADVEMPFWAIETMSQASLSFGWEEDEVTANYAKAVGRLAHPRAQFHRALALSWLEPSLASHLAVHEMSHAVGPEWVVDSALRTAEFSKSAIDLEPAIALMNQRSLLVFMDRLPN